MKRCREATTDDPKAKHYLDILLSSVEYETFVKLMRLMRPVAQQRLLMKADSKTVTTDGDNISPSKANSNNLDDRKLSPAKNVASAGGSSDSKFTAANDDDYDFSDVKGSSNAGDAKFSSK